MLQKKPACPVNLCLDAGYFGADSHPVVEREGMSPHSHPRDQEKEEKQAGKKPRRWVVDWLNRYWRFLVRWEKKESDYRAFLQIACAITALAHLFPG